MSAACPGRASCFFQQQEPCRRMLPCNTLAADSQPTCQAGELVGPLPCEAHRRAHQGAEQPHTGVATTSACCPVQQSVLLDCTERGQANP